MKKVLAAVLAAGLLLSGCGVIRDNDQVGAYVSTSVLDMTQKGDTGRVLTSAAVYFYNDTSKTLTAEPRKLIVETDTNPAEVAVEKLLEGPAESSGLKSVAPFGIKLDYIEFSRQVANVYLLYDGEPMGAREEYILKLAIANTVTDILGAAYICVFINGMQTGIAGEPTAPLKKQTGSVDAAWATASAPYTEGKSILTAVETTPDESAPPQPGESAPPTESAVPVELELQTVLYYLSADGGYLLPEVHTIRYTQGHVIEALVAELKKNPNNTALMKSPLPNDAELLSSSLTDTDGGRLLTLDFSKIADLGASDAVLSYAAVIYTLTGFVPGIDTVALSVAGQPVTWIEGMNRLYDGIQRSDFVGYIGSSAPLYFADKNSDLLLEVSRSMEQEKTWSARARVLEMLKGPLQGDGENVWPVMPPGVTADDILSVDVYGDTAYVNLSQHFKDVCANMSPKTEMLLVYAIVNTITAMDGVSKVQFLIESQQIQELAGTLCMADPFLKNYGIIKKSG